MDHNAELSLRLRLQTADYPHNGSTFLLRVSFYFYFRSQNWFAIDRFTIDSRFFSHKLFSPVFFRCVPRLFSVRACLSTYEHGVVDHLPQAQYRAVRFSQSTKRSKSLPARPRQRKQAGRVRESQHVVEHLELAVFPQRTRKSKSGRPTGCGSGLPPQIELPSNVHAADGLR